MFCKSVFALYQNAERIGDEMRIQLRALTVASESERAKLATLLGLSTTTTTTTAPTGQTAHLESASADYAAYVAANVASIESKASAGKQFSAHELVAFGLLSAKRNLFNHVKFISHDRLVALCEASKEIRVYRVSAPHPHSHGPVTKLIRCIKLNRAPRDIRLFSRDRAVVLVERNLHLFDLDKCAHLLDLNSTMNLNVPLFEIHDHTHVVLLARNRLSVILMRVPFDKLEKFAAEKEAVAARSVFFHLIFFCILNEKLILVQNALKNATFESFPF